jgi:hypothetical protein
MSIPSRMDGEARLRHVFRRAGCCRDIGHSQPLPRPRACARATLHDFFRPCSHPLQNGRPRSIVRRLLTIPSPAPTTPPTITPGGPAIKPNPAAMPAPERPRSPVVVPQPHRSAPAKIINPIAFIFTVHCKFSSAVTVRNARVRRAARPARLPQP